MTTATTTASGQGYAPAACWAIFDNCGKPMRSGISFNSEDEAWRCYFCNRSGWERMREFSRQHGYKCVRATLTPNKEVKL